MFPPLFAIVSVDSAVQQSFGTPVRVLPFDEAPQGIQRPYAVWQIYGGSPYNYLGAVPDMDSFICQVDVYADTVSAARTGALALRNALEPHAHITSWRGEYTDKDTGFKRYSFDVEFHQSRSWADSDGNPLPFPTPSI